MFVLRIWVSRTRADLSEIKVKEIKEMAIYLQEDGAGQDEVKTEKMSS